MAKGLSFNLRMDSLKFSMKLKLRLKELVKVLVKRQKWLHNLMFLGLGLLLVLVMALAFICSHIAEGKKLMEKQSLRHSSYNQVISTP